MVICLFFAGPLLWLVSLSIRTAAEVYVSDIRLWPKTPTLENYRAALGNPLFLDLPLERPEARRSPAPSARCSSPRPPPTRCRASSFRHRNLAMIGLLAFQMISPLVIMVPLYRYMDRVGLTDSHFGAAADLHRDRRAALHLDAQGLPRRHPAEPRGRGDDRRLHPLRRLHAVILPLSLPGLTSAFVLNAILGWSQFIIPFILLSKPSLLPIAVGIFNFQGTYQPDLDPDPRGRRACSRSCRRSSSSSCCSASSSAR